MTNSNHSVRGGTTNTVRTTVVENRARGRRARLRNPALALDATREEREAARTRRRGVSAVHQPDASMAKDDRRACPEACTRHGETGHGGTTRGREPSASAERIIGMR